MNEDKLTYELRRMANAGWMAVVEKRPDGSERQIDFLPEAAARAMYKSLTGEAWPEESSAEP